MQLFICELKRILKSKAFWIILLIMYVHMHTQMGVDMHISKPQMDGEPYGRIMTDDVEDIKEGALYDLLVSYKRNSFDTYPMGFYRKRELSVKDTETMTKMISSLTGLTYEAVSKLKTNNILWEDLRQFTSTKTSKALSEEEFYKAMAKVDQIIGGGSFFDRDRISHYYGYKEASYEEALGRYNDLVKKDRISGGIGRYMNDYLGMTMIIFTAVLTTLLWHEDSRKKVNDIMSLKSISSIKIVVTRNLAIIVSFLFISFIFASFYNILIVLQYPTHQVSLFRIYWITLMWELPIITMGVAIGSLITIVTSKTLAIPVVIVGWFVSLNLFSGQLVGNYGSKLILRHNSVYGRALFYNALPSILLNRIAWIGISMIVIVLTIKIYDQKRRGKFLI